MAVVRARGESQWRIPATQFSKGADPVTLDRRVAELRLQVQIVREMASPMPIPLARENPSVSARSIRSGSAGTGNPRSQMVK